MTTRIVVLKPQTGYLSGFIDHAIRLVGWLKHVNSLSLSPRRHAASVDAPTSDYRCVGYGSLLFVDLICRPNYFCFLVGLVRLFVCVAAQSKPSKSWEAAHP